MNTSVNTCLSVIRLGSAGMKPNDILQAPRLTQLLCVTARTGDRYVRKVQTLQSLLSLGMKNAYFTRVPYHLRTRSTQYCYASMIPVILLSHSKLVITSEGGNGLGKIVYFR